LNKGDIENAERRLNLALQADPALWLTYFMRARIFMRQHKYDLTIQGCTLAAPSNLELKRCQRHLALFKQRQPVRM
jgi:Tfp pilus assembly protein PilF